MFIKDYYTILELPPSASIDEIKKSYRRLAHLYHPDKKGNDPYAASRFSEIKEAYETLTSPVKKDQYLQQRWYAQSMGVKKKQAEVNPETMLKRMLELDRYIHTLDIHRVDQEGMYHYMKHILSDENIDTLNTFREGSVNKEIIQLALKNGQIVPYDALDDFTKRLHRMEIPGISFSVKINELLRQRKQSRYWEKWKPWLILLAVLLLCLVLFLAAGN